MKRNIEFRPPLRDFELCFLWIVNNSPGLDITENMHYYDAWFQFWLSGCFEEEYIVDEHIYVHLSEYGKELLSKQDLSRIPTDPDMYLRLWQEWLEYKVNV